MYRVNPMDPDAGGNANPGFHDALEEKDEEEERGKKKPPATPREPGHDDIVLSETAQRVLAGEDTDEVPPGSVMPPPVRKRDQIPATPSQKGGHGVHFVA